MTAIAAAFLLWSTTLQNFTTFWTGIAFVIISLGNVMIQGLRVKLVNRRLGQLREEMFTNPLAIKVDIKEANDIAQTGVKGTLHWFDGEFYDRHYFFEFSEDHERVLYRLAA